MVPRTGGAGWSAPSQVEQPDRIVLLGDLLYHGPP